VSARCPLRHAEPVIRLQVLTAEENHAARRLYERNGFRLTGDVGELMPHGVTRALVMTLVL
jgi:RimJ/RimL family protein N-acetyltransferase